MELFSVTKWTGDISFMGFNRVLCKNMKERDCMKKTGKQGRIILKQIFKKYDCKVRNGFIWLRPDASGRLLRTC
jgi:hypothetical protein